MNGDLITFNISIKAKLSENKLKLIKSRFRFTFFDEKLYETGIVNDWANSGESLDKIFQLV